MYGNTWRLLRMAVAAVLSATVLLGGCSDERDSSVKPPDDPNSPAQVRRVLDAEPAPETTAARAETGPQEVGTTDPRVTAASSGDVQFAEDFVDPDAFYRRFDHGFSGEVLAGSLFNDAANDWHADHDPGCGNPNETTRVIHIDPSDPAPGVESQFYGCIPGGDPAKAHVMTSVNTQGYNIAWFSPKQEFVDVQRVCWDQNLTFLGNGKWTQVEFLTPAEYEGNGSDLGFTSPDFPNDGGVSTPRGTAGNGVKIGVFDTGTGTPMVNLRTWLDGSFVGAPEGHTAGAGTTDKAPRYQLCAIDGVGVSVALPSGETVTVPVTVDIPSGSIRVVFQDDNYNPDKHFTNDREVDRDSSGLYTWHWDNIQIS